MTERENVQKPNIRILMVIILAVFAAVVIIIVAVSRQNQKSAGTAAGREYLERMESMDPAAIENTIYEASRRKVLDELQQTLENDPSQVWRLLSELNTVMMGDSRVVGFDVFGFMDESHVLASAGATLHLVPDYYDTLAVLNPGLLVLSYGVNDINSYWIWENEEEYLAELNEVMETLTAMLPNCYIYVQSTIEVSEAGLEPDSNWYNIPEWNEAIRQDCLEHGWRYLDITDVVHEHWEMHEVDGIHMMAGFYQYWAEALLMQYLADTSL